LGPKEVQDFRAKAYADLQLKVAGEFCSFPCSSEESTEMNGVAMSNEQHASYNAMQDIPDR
jgi:hypothetical protein